MPPDTPPESHETWNPPRPAPRPDPRADTWVAPDRSGDGAPLHGASQEPDERYTETGLLGRGGIAEVRSGVDGRLGREVAIKRLQRLDSKVGRRRFHREARITAQLEHPGIVPIYDADIDEEGVPFYTMKYVRGTALSTALHEAKGLQGRMELLPAFGAVCQAMAYAHARRVIHRDLKPDNIMLGEFGEALVVDWGLARALDEADDATEEASLPPSTPSSARPVSIEGGPLTVIGQVSGTPAYMAPEQARGEPTSPATDVFALGAVLYQILTGLPPHGIADDIHEQLRRARSDAIAPVRKRSPFTPPDLAAIAERCLAFHPSDRYPTAAALAKDVERWSSGRLVRAYRYGPVEQVRRLASLYWMPLGLAAVGLASVTVVGAIGIVRTQAEAERAQKSEAAAMAAAEDARRDLALMLTDRGQRALEVHDGPRSRALAAASLALVEDPVARGQLADAWTRPALDPLWTLQAPHACAYVLFHAGVIYCGGDGQVSGLDPRGDVLWTTPLPSETVSTMALEEGRLWIGTMDGVVLLDPSDGRLVDHGGGGFVVTMLPTGDGGIRSSQWPSSAEDRFLVEWRPPGVPIATHYGGSTITAWQRRDGEDVRLRNSGALTRGRDGALLADVGHVAYAMAPLTEGWLVAGSSTTWLRDDGSAVPLEELSGSLGYVHTNDRDQVVGTRANHELIVYDLPSRRLLASLPPDGDGVRPGLDLHGSVLVASHEDRIRAWRIPHQSTTTLQWKLAEERADGQARLYCGHDGQAELHDLARGTVTPLQAPGIDAPAIGCMFVDGLPVGAWMGRTVQWSLDGTPTEPDLPLRHVEKMIRVGGELVVEGKGQVASGDHLLGSGIIDVTPDGSLVVQDVSDSVVRWMRPGPDGWTTLHEQHLDNKDVYALTSLPGHRVIEAPRLANRGRARILGPEEITHVPDHPTKLTAAHALDARWLVTGDQAGTLRLWDLPAGTLRAQVSAHEARVFDIYVTGEGARQRIISKSFDQSIHAWSVPMLHLPRGEAVDAVRQRDGLVFRDGEVRHAVDER